MSLSHDVAFFLILPPILFLGGMHLNREVLKQDWSLIAFLAIPGVVASALLVGFPLSYFWHIPINYALLFGALICPTDPVTTLAIMKKLKTPARLRTILEAESLFNDGTGIVLFMVILTMIQKQGPFNFSNALMQFLLISGGGILVGGTCGYFINRIIKVTDNYILHLALSAILVFGTPLLAERLHCSGIIAIVVAGLMSFKAHEKTIKLWTTLDIILNTLIFLIIGLQLQVIGIHHLIQYKIPLATGIIVVLVSRAMVVYATRKLCNRFLNPSLPEVWDLALIWGGLRGTIPIILMMQLPAFEGRELFLSAGFAIVLFSIIVQGITIEGLLKER